MLSLAERREGGWGGGGFIITGGEADAEEGRTLSRSYLEVRREGEREGSLRKRERESCVGLHKVA